MNWTAVAEAARSVVMDGSAGRYRSMVSGPSATMKPSVSTSRIRPIGRIGPPLADGLVSAGVVGAGVVVVAAGVVVVGPVVVGAKVVVGAGVVGGSEIAMRSS
ncbi:hypothetical protein GCM10028799_00320 [Kribbella italica]